MTQIPPDVLAALRPMPADFAITTVDIRGHTAWRGSVQFAAGEHTRTVPIEYAAGHLAPPDALRVHVWLFHEFARLGREDLLEHARADRHTRGRARRRT